MLQEDRIRRIREMEQLFDAVSADPEGNLDELELLVQYHESGLWLLDYEADEKGELPPELKRGVLSQDGLYDLLQRLAY